MSESQDPAPRAETDPDALPHVDDFAVTVEQAGREWTVVTVADGVRKEISKHSSQAEAEREAEGLHAVAIRHETGPREEAIPDTYPGKGVDETQPG